MTPGSGEPSGAARMDRSEGENPAPHSGAVQVRDGGKLSVANRRSMTPPSMGTFSSVGRAPDS